MKINYFIYVIQHNFGILPRWERELIENDVHLKTFKRWMVKRKNCTYCHELYHNRLNYLRGWIN